MTFHMHEYFSCVDLDLRNQTKFSWHFSDFSMILIEFRSSLFLKLKRKKNSANRPLETFNSLHPGPWTDWKTGEGDREGGAAISRRGSSPAARAQGGGARGGRGLPLGALGAG